MTLVNVLRDRVTIQVSVPTRTALGETVVWKRVSTRYARVISLDARVRAVYQQIKSEVSHKVIFRGSVDISFGTNRLLWKGKILEPVEPAQSVGDSTIVVVKET